MTKNLLACELFAVSVLPVIPLNTGLIPMRANPIILATALLVVVVIIYLRMSKKVWTWEDIGFSLSKKTFNIESISAYALVTIIFCLAFLEIYGESNKRSLNLQAVVISATLSFAQVIIFQGYLMKIGKQVFRNYDSVNIFVNVVLFTFMHSFYPSLDFKEYALLAIAGIGFATMYHFYPNIYLVGAFHFATNLVAIHLGMFTRY